ncbi:pickpocket protein 28-like [Aphidius gifuensis]|uniref:pickpocket protein 28-like n=1 Tax=Aphidius gifuensis TaxID=684658 RepID=UPI001CDD1552|nr:pickpocket protein 28-like [Aphidius gifuensis]
MDFAAHLIISKVFLKPEPYVNPSAGQLSGLTVELKPKLNDYFFPFLPTTGFKITIFNPGDYPDNTSGGVSEVLIAPNTESFMKLDASTFYSTEAVRDITLSSRKCLFSDESTVLSAGYTYSDCLVDCRVNEIIRLCECRPFYLPRRGNNENAQRVCDTSDAKCLQQHKKQLWSVQLQGSVNPDANDDSLNCRHCYPACHDVRYTLEISSANLAQESTMGNASILRVSNSSLVHIYFPKFGTIRLKQDIGYYWYELLSDIGGTCGVFIGFSLISVIEFFYIFIRLIWSTVNQRKKIIEISSIETDVNDNNHNNSGNIYWSELMTQPKNTHSVVVHNRPKFRRY